MEYRDIFVKTISLYTSEQRRNELGERISADTLEADIKFILKDCGLWEKNVERRKAMQTEEGKLIIRKHHKGRKEKGLAASHGCFKHFNHDLRNSKLCSPF